MRSKLIPYIPGFVAIVSGAWGVAPNPEGCYDCGMAKGVIVACVLIVASAWSVANAFLYRSNFLRVLVVNLICVAIAIAALVAVDGAS